MAHRSLLRRISLPFPFFPGRGVTVLFGILLLLEGLPAFPGVPEGMVWRQAWEKPFRLLGFKWFDPSNPVFCRLPPAPGLPLRKPVRKLSFDTAGGQVRFRTTSGLVALRAVLPRLNRMDHMAVTGQDGFDLYVREGRVWKFLKTTRVRGRKIEQVLFRGSGGKTREFLLDFPLYCGVKSVEIGLERGARVEGPSPFEDEGCLVFYGTSITQGGCASRPGMAYTNILGRRLDREVVNLGFSGNGLGERELAVLIGRIPRKDLVVLDYEANAGEGVRKTLEPFIAELRKKEPALPILVVSKIPYAVEVESGAARKARLSLRDFQRDLVRRLRKAGDDRIFFLDGSTLLGEDWWECTVAGVHPNDLGFFRMAEAMAKKIREILLLVRAGKPENTWKVWPKGNPGGWKNPKPEKGISRGRGTLKISNVNDPTLVVFRPDRVTDKGIGVVVCPGGGYRVLSYYKEGRDVALRLSREGFWGFLLKYRLPRKGLDEVRWAPALQDAQRAIRLVRARSRKEGWGLRKVGIMGFSAGGHLSAVTAAKGNESTYPKVDGADDFPCRPDFAVLVYPAYLVDRKGRPAPELDFDKGMPPVFLLQTEDDPIRVENALYFYLALKRKRVPAEMHLFAEGRHGYGMRKRGLPVDSWPDLLVRWLARR